MNPIIPKETDMPQLNKKQLEQVTELTFHQGVRPKKCDAIFVFSGTHPGHWEKAIEAYKLNLAPLIIVTGGRSMTGISHPEWDGRKFQSFTEASVIISFLLQAGIPEDKIIYEDQSTNSLENVLYVKEVIDFTRINSMLVICKSHAAGRQIRTLMKHFPSGLSYIPYPFNATYQNKEITRQNWLNTEIGRKRVWGEYRRIIHYGQLGHLVPPEEEMNL
ncbi:YdcF family protein [Bacillus sp. Marseille-Q1617]|uniref:YdcF family protein n=1 Tax=Bacillus sp. Marseille-Q1617 TaxID=2736887 RepID=UPI00158C3C59|nr:YdcF family protein [Bacillus sp. Marseille-Q1617]